MSKDKGLIDRMDAYLSDPTQARSVFHLDYEEVSRLRKKLDSGDKSPQDKAIAARFKTAAAFPLKYELEDGAIDIMVPVAFADRRTRTFPHDIEFEMVRIAADGEILSEITTYYYTNA